MLGEQKSNFYTVKDIPAADFINAFAQYLKKNNLIERPKWADMSKDFCINPLIKITIQSKALFTIALHCATVPNAASERQTLPPLYN